MSKFNKRILALLLAAMMLLSLAACGEAKEEAPAEMPAAEETAAPAEEAQAAESDAEEAEVKNIKITVVFGDGTSKELEISTKAENLRGALEPEGIIAGDESEYGLFVKTVDGVTADDAKQEWWCITKGGEMLNTGVDDTLIADGESYEFTLTTGY